jgi:predicted metal-binding membrane protein
MRVMSSLETILRRDRIVIFVSIAGITALAWTYIAYLAWGMDHMAMSMQTTVEMTMEMSMPQMATWNGVGFGLTFVMWSVMMVAMMLPSASPMILLFAKANRNRRQDQHPYVPTALFALGYLVLWIAFSGLATLAQWGLHTAALLSPMMVVTSPIIGGILLITAGLFQWTPLKSACLHQCRSPLGFLMQEWRDGRWGAFHMGIKHGIYCVGCCWVLMALLFVAGVMNLLWVAAITGLVLVEKIAPAGHWIGRVAGVLLIAGGLWMAVTQF